MHSSNKLLFHHVLQHFLNETNDSYNEMSLCIQLNDLSVQEGLFAVKLRSDMCDGMYNRKKNLFKFVDDHSYFATAVQCDYFVSERLEIADWIGNEVDDHPLRSKVAALLGADLSQVKIRCIDDDILILIDYPDSSSTSQMELTQLFCELLSCVVPMDQPIESIGCILFPMICAGSFHVLAEKSGDGFRIRQFNRHGTMNGKLEGIKYKKTIQENVPSINGIQVKETRNVKFVNGNDHFLESFKQADSVKNSISDLFCDNYFPATAENNHNVANVKVSCSPETIHSQDVIPPGGIPKEVTQSSGNLKKMDNVLSSVFSQMDVLLNDLNPGESFAHAGIDSLQTAELEHLLKMALPDQEIPNGLLTIHNSVEKLRTYLVGETSNEDISYPPSCSLTPQQQQIVFMNELNSTNRSQFNEPVMFRIEKNIFRQDDFVSSFRMIMMRHSILRTMYTIDRQRILSGTECYMIASTSKKFMESSIDILNDVSVVLNILEEDSCYSIAILFHHIAVDGSSIGILMRDLFQAYSGANLSTSPSQYVQYALEDKTDSNNLSYWREKLLTAELEPLSTDYPRSNMSTMGGSTIEITLTEKLVNDLKTLRVRYGCSDFAIFTAIYKLLIYKFFGLTDYIVGSAVSLRNDQHMGTVGCFVNTLPLRSAIDGDNNIRELFENVRTAVEEMKENRATPFNEIVNEMKMTSDTLPLFQVLLVMDRQNSSTAMKGVDIVHVPLTICKYEQTWYFRNEGRRWTIAVEYCNELFKKETIRSQLDTFQFLIHSLVKVNPLAKLHNISIISKSAQNNEDECIASNKTDFPRVSVSSMFRRQTHSGTWKSGSTSWNYNEVRQQSAAFGYQLTQKYVRTYAQVPSADKAVLIYQKRSLLLPSTVLAAWQAGFCAVPISLDWTIARIKDLAAMLHDPLIASDNEEVDASFVCAGYPTMKPSSYSQTTSGRGIERVRHDDVAYITCTSGTTGPPKAVCTPFVGQSNLAMNYLKTFSISHRSVVYQVVNPAFDIFFADLSKVLSSGCSVVLAASTMPQWSEMGGVTNAYIMPAYLSAMHKDDIERLSSLETLHFGGEPIQPRALQMLIDKGVSAFEEYGLTEQTVYTSCHRKRKGQVSGYVGTPYKNLSIVCKDRDGNIVPTGGRGTLHISGMLARGYHSNSVLNGKKFQKMNGIREFSTGDLAVRSPDGIILGGRDDQQVKIRGKIVQLGEIQQCLSSHYSVSESVVSFSDKDNTIVAHVVALDKSPKCIAKFKEHLTAQLPDFMVPAHIIFLDKLPLNANGKVDRKQLPQPIANVTEPKTQSKLSPSEQLLAQSFSKYLPNSFVRPDQCFFEAGGTSVTAMLVVQDLQERGISIVLRDIFTYRTLTRIAERIEMSSKKLEVQTEVVQDNLNDDHESHGTLTPTQQRIWFLSQLQPDCDTYILKLRLVLKGKLDKLKLIAAVLLIIIGNRALRTKISAEQGIPQATCLSGTECYQDLSTRKVLEPPSPCAPVSMSINIEKGSECLDVWLHHVASDGRSIAIIAEQLVKAYQGETITFQIAYHKSEEVFDLKFWSEYLSDYDGQPNPKERSGIVGRYEVDMSSFTSDRISSAARRYNCTAFHLLTSAVVETYRQLQDTDDVIIATTVDVRDAKTIDTVGMNVNTIPLRFKKRYDQPGRTMEYVIGQVSAALDHKNSPTSIAEIVETGTELYSNLINYQNTSLHEMPQIEGLAVTATLEPPNNCSFSVSWMFSDSKNGIDLTLEYDSAVLNQHEAETITNSFRRNFYYLLTGKNTDPNHFSPVVDTPTMHSMDQIFKFQSSRSSQREMLTDGVNKYTYNDSKAEIDCMSSRISRVVIRNYCDGLRPDDIIAIILPEGRELQLAVQAVLKLGCAYLCIAMSNPPERRSAILNDSGAKLVITADSYDHHEIPSTSPLTTVSANSLRVPRLLKRTSFSNIAYVIYTSGTTGLPKGVCVNHNSSMNMLHHATKLYKFRPGCRVLQFTKSSFDASISNTFGCLLNGGTICIRNEEAEVASNIAALKPSIVHATPIVLDTFDEADIDRLSTIESWSYGGEPMAATTLSRFVSSGRRLVQLYGPTEATCYQTSLIMKTKMSNICIGKLIPNVPYSLRSFGRHKSPRHTQGQLALAGVQLARGYINRKELTERTFVRNTQLSREELILGRNIKMYLTGDRVEVNPRGFLHFRGRMDDQIKIKGHRCEIGEIEAVIGRFDGVRQCIAVLQKDPGGTKQLVVFYIGEQQEEISMMKQCSTKLPSHMLPARIIRLTDLPVTVNAKVDRKLLEKRNDLSTTENDDISSEMQKRIQKVYEKVLKRTVKLSDNFFYMGGHSLLATQLVHFLNEELNRNIPLVKVLEFPTVAQMASYIELQESAEDRIALPISMRDCPTILQMHLLRYYRNSSIQQLYNITTRIRMKSRTSRERLIHAVNTTIMVHPSLRTMFNRKGKAYKCIVLSGTESYSVVSTVRGEALNVFESPAFRATLEIEDVLRLNVNHVLVDGHSMAVLANTMISSLNGKDQQVDNHQSFAAWIDEQFAESDHLQFWKNSLPGWPSPTNRRSVSSTTTTLNISIHNLTSHVEKLSHEHGCTPFAVLVALLSSTFSRIIGKNHPVPIGFPVNLRKVEHENAVTYGINTLAVAVQITGNSAEDIKQSSAEVIEAMAHPFVQFEDLLKTSNIDSLFDVMLTCDSYSAEENEHFEILENKDEISKFPMSIFIDPRRDVIRLLYWNEYYTKDIIESTIDAFAAVLHQWSNSSTSKSSSQTRTYESNSLGRTKLSHQQQQMFYLSVLPGSSLVLPFIKKISNDTASFFHTALMHLVQRHEQLRTIFLDDNGGEPYQETVSFTESYHTYREMYSSDVRRTIAEECAESMELSQSQLRANILKCEEETFAVLYLHHIVSDAWSTSIIERDMEEMINKLSQGHAIDCQRQSHSYSDYASTSKPTCSPNDHTMLKVLRQYTPMKPISASSKINVASIIIPNSYVQSICSATNVSPAAVFLDIVSRAISKTFKLKKLNVGMPNSNRTKKTKDVVGYFLNNLVLSIDYDTETSYHSVQALLNRTLEANVPFSNLVQAYRTVKKNNDAIFDMYLNCRYDLESVKDSEEDYMASLLPLRCEFPIEIDVDLNGDQYKLTLRTKESYININQANVVISTMTAVINCEKVIVSLAPDVVDASDFILKSIMKSARLVLKRETIDPDSGFYAAGGNSLSAIAFLEELEESFDSEFPIEIVQAASFREMAQLVKQVCNPELEHIGSDHCIDAEKAQEVSSPVTLKTTEIPNIDNMRKVDIPNVSLSHLLNTQFNRYKHQCALKNENNKRLTYAVFLKNVRDLSNRIRESYFRCCGSALRSDSIIPVLVDRSTESIINCLAIISAGAAYLPVDNHIPLTKFENLIAQSFAHCYLSSIEKAVSIPRLSLETRTKRQRLYSTNLVGDVSYVISTSGTTGIPKAVCATHRGVLNMMRASSRDFFQHSRDVIYQFTSLVYDNSVLEIWSGLAHGASLMVDEQRFSPRRFAKQVSEQGVTHCLLFPGIVAIFKEASFEALKNLRYWIVGAEKLPRDMLDRAIAAGINVIQNYGPTETTAYALSRHMRRCDHPQNLGKAIINTQTKQSGGTSSELLICGIGRMRGYLGKGAPPTDWYSTGDTVTKLPNGDYIFVGRNDSQVKIRGHRIDLGEIECCALKIGGITQAKAVFNEEDQTLVLYCATSEIAEEAISLNLELNLLRHMKPDNVICISQFPLTPNSKIDLSALAQIRLRNLFNPRQKCSKKFLESDIAKQKYTHDTCENKSVNSLRKIWSSVLRHDNFTSEDNFFFSGGNSILLLKLRHIINAEYECNLSVGDLLQNLIFRDMVMMLVEKQKRVSIVEVVRKSLSNGKQLVFLHGLYGGCLAYSHLIESLMTQTPHGILTVTHPHSFSSASDVSTYSDGISKLCDSYADELRPYLGKDVVFIGASIGGSLAMEVRRRIGRGNVVAIDSGSHYEDSAKLTFPEHSKSIRDALGSIDESSLHAVIASSWNLLQQLVSHKMTPFSWTLQLLSIDGTDLGWNRFGRTNVTRLDGTHCTMLDETNINRVVDGIINLI